MSFNPAVEHNLNQLFIVTHLNLYYISFMEKVEGLTYRSAFISKQTETQLIEDINSREWNTSLKRRTQHYGYKYSYDKTNTLQPQQPIPITFEPIKQQIEAFLYELTGQVHHFDQLIINEYLPGQGIAPHIDNKFLFEDVIVGLCLGSTAIMVFQKGQQKHQVLLERRALFVMRGEARQLWKHSIPARKKDQGISRGTRLSMTWRIVKNDKKGK